VNTTKLDRIRKLLQKAEHIRNMPAEGLTPELEKEADALRDSAFAMAAKYHIDAALAAKTGTPREEPEKVKSIFITFGKPQVQLDVLANGISKAMGCKMIVVEKGTSQYKAHVFGFESDVTMFRMLWNSVLVQGERACAASYHGPAGRLYRRYRRSWWQSFANAVLPRVRQMYAKAEKESGASSTSTEIALRDRSLDVQREVESVYAELRKGRRSSTRYNEGGYAGREAGKRVDIGAGKLGGGKKEIS